MKKIRKNYKKRFSDFHCSFFVMFTVHFLYATATYWWWKNAECHERSSSRKWKLSSRQIFKSIQNRKKSASINEFTFARMEVKKGENRKNGEWIKQISFVFTFFLLQNHYEYVRLRIFSPQFSIRNRFKKGKHEQHTVMAAASCFPCSYANSYFSRLHLAAANQLFSSNCFLSTEQDEQWKKNV